MVRAQSTGLLDSMRTVSVLILGVALASSAAAQSNDSVTVNPMGAQVLIDPGTGQQRLVPTLLQPWQKDETIRLHPPRKHHARSVDTQAPVASLPTSLPVSEPTAVAAAPVVRAPRLPRVASAPPPPRRIAPAQPQQVAPSASLDSMGDLVTQSQRSAPLPPPKQITSAPSRPVASKPAQRTASIERANPRTTAGARRDTITFAANATDPSTAAVSAVRTLAGSLNAALSDGTSRVQLLAYGGAKGEKSSDTRRMSLKRALVIRQLLIDDGVPSERIDVFALGGVEDDGPTDRVDVFVKS
jgi:outer membrane protein OmpA-like peptidoglycan-associated protein